MKKNAAPARNDTAAKATAEHEATENEEPDLPQNGFGKFEYINQTMYVGEWKLHNKRKVKHGQGKITFPGVQSA